MVAVLFRHAVLYCTLRTIVITAKLWPFYMLTVNRSICDCAVSLFISMKSTFRVLDGAMLVNVTYVSGIIVNEGERLEHA